MVVAKFTGCFGQQRLSSSHHFFENVLEFHYKSHTLPIIKEKRRDLRVALDWSAVLWKGDRARGAVLTKIRAIGTSLLSDEPLRPKKSFKAFITAPKRGPLNLNFQAACLGVDCSQDNLSSYGIGIRFTGISGPDRQFLCDVIAKQHEGKTSNK